MRTVLLVEDSFIESFDLECRFKEMGYAVKIAGTLAQAKEVLRKLDGDIAGIVCDNRLICGEPGAATFYAYSRSRASSIPFVVYSAFPPTELPKDDPFLAIVTKPFLDDVIKHVRHFASILDKKRAVLPAQLHREAA